MSENPQVELFRSAMLRQSGGGDIQVFRGATRYQYGQGFGDVLRGIWKVIVPVAMRAGKTLFKVGAQAVKEGSTPGDALKSAIRPALRTVLKHGGRALGDAILAQPTPAPPVEPPLLHQDTSDVGAVPPLDLSKEIAAQGGLGYKGRRKRRATSKSNKSKSHKKSTRSTKYNF